MKTLEAISNFISKYMAAFVIIVAAIALFMPWTFTWSAKYVTYLLGIVMFGMGMTLRFEDFKLVFKRPKDVFIGALAQFTIMPALAWVLATLFQLPPELAVGVILVGTCPGGTSSNVMTYLARGDVAFTCIYDNEQLQFWRQLLHLFSVGGSLVHGLIFLYKQ